MSDRARIDAERIVLNDLNEMCRALSAELAKMAGKNLLVTGGAGFLGYYFVQTITHFNRTAARRIGLTVFDNFSRGVPAWLTGLRDSGELRVLQHDMTHPLPRDMDSFQYIIHAASIASPTFYREHPIETMDANINGLRSLLDYAVAMQHTKGPVEGVLFLSSSEIYGDPDAANIPTREDYRGLVSCTGPRACYDEAKRYGETLCVNFARQRGIPAKIARPFNNFGPGLKLTDGRVLPDFCRDVFAGRDIVVLSDGSPTRTFCYVADAVTGYFKVLVNGRNGEAYNIGVETPEISMRDVAEKVVALGRELFGYTGKATFGRSNDPVYLTDNPNRRCPVIAKARQHVGFAPSVTLDEGLRRAMIWYGGNRQLQSNETVPAHATVTTGAA